MLLSEFTRSFRRVLFQSAVVFGAVLLCVSASSQERAAPAQATAVEKIVSGPQVGEAMPAAEVWITSAEDKPSSKSDLAAMSKEGPLAVVFMHEKSRPGFGLARLMSELAARRKAEKLQFVVVVLTEDRSSSEQWLGLVRRYFPEPTQLSVADGGIEGPGSLGLNRAAALTILVAKEGKVTANFALTQVSEPTDGPAVLEAMNQACGGGAIPPIDELRPRPNRTK